MSGCNGDSIPGRRSARIERATGLDENWVRLEREQLASPGDLFRAGATTCVAMMTEVENRTLPSSRLDETFRWFQNWRPETSEFSDYRSGFTEVCRYAADFTRRPMTEPHVRRSLDRILAGYYPSDLEFLRLGINPNEAERSIVQNPRLFVRGVRTPHSNLNTVHVYTVVPVSLEDAENALVSQVNQMGRWTTLLYDDTRVVSGTPNLEGTPFTLRVGMHLPVIPDRHFDTTVTARRVDVTDQPGRGGRGLEIRFQYVPNSGNLRRFDGTTRVRSVGPNRLFVHYELFVDLATAVPDFFINQMQTGKLATFASELLTHLRRR